MGKMMKAAQETQEKMARMQEDLALIEVIGESGAGLVKATATAKGELTGLEIDPSIFNGNEKEIGKAFAHAFSEGIVTREELFVTGKLWNSDHDVEIVPQACRHSLKNLGLDYFDLYLIHFPVCWKHTGLDTPSWGKSELGDTSLIDTWRAMEKLVDEGKCKSIGVSNYPLMLLHDLVTQARVPVSCNCLLYTSPSPRDKRQSRMPSSA